MTRRRSRRLVFLVACVLALMLAETGLVVAVFVSPTTGERMSDAVASLDRAWNGSKDSKGVRTRIADSVDRGYRSWIETLWKAPEIPRGDDEFDACLGCHKDYASARRFTNVYMNHPLHAEQGVACGTCHVQNEHPDPVRPEERTCQTCHDEVREPGKCGLCHPPASLPHFYLLGAPRDQVVECSTCHPKQSFRSTADERLVPTNRFDGSQRAPCTQCHQQQTCEECHATSHPPDWIAIHGGVVAENPTPCYTCHTGDWCTSRCHAVTSTNPFVPRPMPSAGVRP